MNPSGEPAPDRLNAAFALIEKGPHGFVVAAVNAAAKGLGLSEGLRFMDAKARAPHLLYEEIDRRADADALSSLAHWMIRFTPIVAIDGRDGLILETTGCDHLHGGEAEMLASVQKALNRQNISNAMGIAGTPLAAAALARAAPGTVLAEGEEAQGLAPLSIGVLRLSESAETLLRRFGLTQVGQLYAFDRQALARRFPSTHDAEAVLRRLDQALGHRSDPLVPLRPEPLKAARLPCPEPLLTVDGVRAGLQTLTTRLCADLSAAGEGARAFTLYAFRSDGTMAAADVAAALPVRDAPHIRNLFTEHVEKIDPGFGVDMLVLEARSAGAMDAAPLAFSGDLATRGADQRTLAALADRICVKLGEGSVTVARPVASHVPERAEAIEPFADALARDPAWPALSKPMSKPMSGSSMSASRMSASARPPSKAAAETFFSAASAAADAAGPRPLRLLLRPEPVNVIAEAPDGPPLHFLWRRTRRVVRKADGPERIAPEWWRYTAPQPAAPQSSGAAQRWLTPKFDPRADAALIRETRAALARPPESSDDKEPSDHKEPSGPSAHAPRTRDYYRVEDESGRRYWLFREGLYDDGRGGSPYWYLHGLFA